MSELKWHPDALRDVGRLYDFLAPASPAAARRAATVIVEAADKIAAIPGIGTRCAEFREWRAKLRNSAYILRYCVLPEGDILITRV